jgi:hypothetical protein
VLKIEILSRRHNRDGFDCGSDPLNTYLRHTARQHIERGISRTLLYLGAVVLVFTAARYFNVQDLLKQALDWVGRLGPWGPAIFIAIHVVATVLLMPESVLTLTGPDTIEVGGQSLRFAKAVIATGARAAAPPIPGLKEVPFLTNETLFPAWLDRALRVIIVTPFMHKAMPRR